MKLTREKKQITFKGKPIRLTSDFSEETLRARREWRDIVNKLQENKGQPRIPYPAKLSFLYEERIRIFPDKEKLRNFITTKPPLQKILQGVLKPETQRDK